MKRTTENNTYELRFPSQLQKRSEIRQTISYHIDGDEGRQRKERNRSDEPRVGHEIDCRILLRPENFQQRPDDDQEIRASRGSHSTVVNRD